MAKKEFTTMRTVRQAHLRCFATTMIQRCWRSHAEHWEQKRDKAAVLIQTQARGIFARHKVEKKREAAKDTQQPQQQEQAHGKGTPPGKGAAEAIAEEELHSLGIKDAQ